ncbi:RagB/SusD family nutrient uptake outer membrane protein [Rufibacter sediminis]|uniref:RagB/SusD family nutrient uptake outer membrane protein n=1 Tax=Rufibacter sediminis TaxID=2762756 RepID=A0ABR6VY47_9BACT|nr:RagB/SusD family nutrient uptake outer membrane protein [Rufibacter sediminis]MBC3541837.1 RagB/SusD family nutrient uptake outer membrane protein [Rufibacter sediminis]
MKNYTIKRILRVALVAPLFSLSFAITSCEDEVIDLEAPDRYTEIGAFESAARIQLVMNGVYDAAQSGFYAGGAVRGYPFGAASIAQGDNRGEDMLNMEAFYQATYENLYSPTTANNQYMWETLYALINKANVAIEGIQGAATSGIITEQVAKEYVAECQFLRALAMHELITNFARPYNHTGDASHLGVPIRLTAVNTPARVDEAKTQGRNTVKEVYDQILKDLNEAEAALPASRSTFQITRATQGAAIALKTRVLLHKGDNAGVITEASKLVTGDAAPFTSPIGGYKLTAEPSGPFGAGNKNNTESIFSILNSAIDNASTNGALPQMYGSAPNRALVAISPVIWNQTFWPAADKRRTQLTDVSTNSYRYTTKYNGDKVTWADNTPIIRYAEVLLNMAEAIARTQGATPKALALLNAVRGRATTEVYTAAGLDTPQKLIQAIVDERRIEFLAEGLRWKDIFRLAVEGIYVYKGIPAKVTKGNTTAADYAAASGTVRAAAFAVPAVPYEDFRFIWPIPTSETAANPVLAKQQNPNY